MTAPDSPLSVAIGWDVGGWNCDKNGKSRDALVVRDSSGQVLGRPWRGNLRQTINTSNDARSLKAALLALCGISVDADAPTVIAIDAPLAFPHALLELLVHSRAEASIGNSSDNPYLFRYTERRLAERGVMPLSAVKDMIGSQSTKAIHMLAKFAPTMRSTGVWVDGNALTVIETYPAACRRRASTRFGALSHQQAAHDDIVDAAVCAEVARLFATNREMLEPPTEGAPPKEGWIWLPSSTLGAVG